jgi:predicted HicB family RNase H-like nuclease
MKHAKFSVPPVLTQEDKEKKAEAFLNLNNDVMKNKQVKENEAEKEPIKTMLLRLPHSLWEDIRAVHNKTSISMNAICLEIIRPGIKKKLRELNEE